jgi:HSP20 family molecular chaperone IbpA
MTSLQHFFSPVWPYQELSRIEDLFYDLDKTGLFSSGFPKWEQFINDKDNEKVLVIQFILAGYPKDKLSVEVFGDKIVISAKKIDDGDCGRFARRAFKKEFHDTHGCWDFDKSTSTYIDGILKLEIPQREAKKGKLLEIK